MFHKNLRGNSSGPSWKPAKPCTKSAISCQPFTLSNVIFIKRFTLYPCQENNYCINSDCFYIEDFQVVS